jgi:hypothetical protein
MTSDSGYIEFRCHRNDPPYKYNEDLVNKQDIVIRTDSTDLNVFQYFNLFKSFLRAISFDNYNILRGAAGIVFNEEADDKTLEKLGREFDFTAGDLAPSYLTEDQKKSVTVYLEQGQLESDTFSLKEIEILDIARNIIREQQEKIKEQEEFLEEWANRYNDEWSKH